MPTNGSRRGPSAPPETRACRIYSAVAYLFLLLPLVAGMIALGGAVWWVAGPLAAAGLLGAGLLALQPLFFKGLRDVRFRRPPGGLLLLCFLLYALARVPFSPVPFDSLREVLAMASYFGAYWAWSRSSGRAEAGRYLLAFLLLVASGLCWYALIQEFRGSNLVLGLPRPEQYGMRASATFGCPNHLGHLLTVFILAATGLLLTRGVGGPLRVVCLYFLALALPVLLMTGSRSAWIGMATGWFVQLTVFNLRRRGRWLFLSSVGVPLLLALLGAGLWAGSATFRGRVQNAIETENMRIPIWRDTVDMILDAPLLGHGPAMYRWMEPAYKKAHDTPNAFAKYAHNEPLHLVAEYGLLGATLLGAALAAIAWTLLRYTLTAHRAANGMLSAVGLAALAGSLAHSLFDFNFHLFANNHALALLLGLVAARRFASGRIVRPALPIGWVVPCVGGGLAALVLAALSLATAASLAHVHFAIRHRQEAAYDRSLHHARRAVAWYPAYADGHRELGSALLSKAVWDRDPETKKDLASESLAEFDRALARNPRDLLTRFSKSQAYSVLGDEEAAVRILQEIVSSSPNHLYYLTQYGLKLRMLGRYDEAWDVFQQAQGVSRKDPMVKANLQLLRSRVSPEKLPPPPARKRRPPAPPTPPPATPPPAS